MRVSDIGEFGLIAEIQRRIGGAAPPPPGARGLLLGVGDDCAVWQEPGGVQVVTTDTVVQDGHFRLDFTSWRDLGWKALAVNLSDIAAMGAAPDHAVITLGMPATTAYEDVMALYDGLAECATHHRTLLVGGDIVSALQVFISITVTGHTSSRIPYPNNVLLRSQAKPGDAIGVTGPLGASAAGLRLLQRGDAAPELAFAREAHRRPSPRLEAGVLALEAGVRCGMDVSDGLIGDLEKLCAASGVAAVVELAQVPVDARLQAAFPDAWAPLALAGGEDYELLLVAPPEVLDAITERSSVPVHVIGRITDGPAGRVEVRDAQGNPVPLSERGWDHLSAGTSAHPYHERAEPVRRGDK